MDMKRSYYEDIELFKSGVILFWTIVFLLVLFTFPLYMSDYALYLLNLIMVYVIVSVGLNILVGSTGQISLGHAGFFAIGAYATVLLMTNLQIPFFIAIIAAAFIAAFFGFILGLPALRLEGPYLTIATLAFGLAIMHVIGHTEFFGGRQGLMAPPLDLGIPQLGWSFVLSSETSKYYLVLIITILMVLFAINILKTKAGRAFVAIRDSDIAAEVIGINLTMYKTLSFAVSAFYAGIGGGLFAFVLGFFDPFTFNLILSIIFIVMIVVGGLGSVMGSITGAALITYLMYDLFKNVNEAPYVGPLFVAFSERWMTITGMDNFNYIALGLVMIGIMLFEPLGMFGAWIRIKKYWKTWPF
ncbi:MAG TPA: branched-chain amino acid ABC transporter permease [Smithellaceae bacterium]|jgi:branched-chain amino acid transport system permease protein|nr:branched-chain amino acid ABC transporter permease [Deltaproteobacteria bacterium]HNV65428.1 branched-chain amino acid ABC transporter permease [Smithellaceae bacterium]HPM21875.1 branched-chain amino acid ABC transporter permease [Thermotogota bacterium]HOD30386.1 branched-chain amino acid ABC transporter permease [Smithellaceae bacterium]HOF77707.1 branched-chain amino acid ABC transporter permease [Smithellaceae bacterium]